MRQYMIIHHGSQQQFTCICNVVVMVIGILALSYQLIEYRNTRRKSYKYVQPDGK